MLKRFARGLAERLGYEVLGPVRAYAARKSMAGLLQHERINLVLDVGANIGQFALELRASGYKGRILSVEPQSEAHRQLRALSASDPAWTVLQRTAVGAENGMVTLNLSENTYSSSVLPMLATHVDAAPASRYIGAEEISVKCLDDLFQTDPGDRVLLKIDVQGYERHVLAGARNILAECRAVTLEMSLVPLYKGETLALEMWEFLQGQGFSVWAIEPGYRDPKTGRMLQVDGLFTRDVQG